MNKEIKNRIIKICNEKIEKKGDNVGVSFYAFFKNKNTEPDILFDVAKWWIKDNKLDHFEKATKIIEMIKKD